MSRKRGPATALPAWERTLRAALSLDPDARPQSVRHFMVEFAIGLEPTGPHVKGGVEILRLIAPKFIAESGHDAETMRDTPHRTIVVAWPRLEAPVRAATAGIPTRPALPRHVQPGQSTPILRGGSGADLPDTPASAIPASATTLGASNGAIPPNPRTLNGRKLAFVAVVAASVTTVAVFAILSGGERTAAPPVAAKPPPAAAPVAPTTSTPTTSTPTPNTPTPNTPMTTKPATTKPATTKPALPATTITPMPQAATRANSSPAASTKKRSDEPRVQKRKFDPNAPAGGEE